MKVLMVCLGNICRSPMADGWLRHKVAQYQLNIEVDSAGTANFHTGAAPDHRMRRLSKKYGVSIDDLKARQFVQADFDAFDRIFAMDKENLNNILKLARNDADRNKVDLFLNQLDKGQNNEVPDPYYGTDDDFIHVIELLDKATNAFLINENLLTS